MVSDQDRDKLIAFTHGELDQIETQRISARLNTDENFRREFEALLAASDALEDFFIQPAKEDLSAEQIHKIMSAVRTQSGSRRGWYLGAGGAAMAACLALVLWTQQHTQIMEKSATEPAAQAVAAAPAVEAEKVYDVSADTQTIAMEDSVPVPETATGIAGNARGNLSKRIGGLAPPAEGRAEMKEMKKGAAAGKVMPKAKRAMKQDLNQEFGASENSADSAQAFLADSPPEMAVAAKVRAPQPKIQFTNIKNTEAAANYIRQTLNGQANCMNSYSNIESITVQVAAGGKITNITTQPINKSAGECLKGLLGESAAAFETTGSSGLIIIKY